MRRLRYAVLLLAGAVACASPAPPTPAPAPVVERTDSTVREAAPAAPVRRHGTATVRFAFVGDINLGTATLADGVPPDSGRALLAAARPALAGDLVLGNFEGVLADSGETEKCGKKRAVVWRGVTQKPAPPSRRRPRARRTKKTAPPILCYAFLTPTLLAPRLADAGFTHLNLANNHANDFGLDGRRSTEATLASHGLETYGPLGRIVIDTVRHAGGVTTVGVIGFTTYPFAYDLLDIPASAAVVDSVHRLVDVLIVTFHGGAEGAAALHLPFAAESLGREPRGDLRAWAHAVVDAGADLVVGHGPHVLRGVEFWNGKPIVYSLGNFATYRGFNLAGPQALTAVLQVELAGDGRLIQARLVPMRQLPLEGPAPDPDAGALRLVRDLSADDFGPTAARVGDDGVLAPP